MGEIMENILTFEDDSDTIRQMPQNYLIAHRLHREWICNPDPACDHKLAERVFNALWEHSTKWGNGLNLLAKVTPNSEFKKGWKKWLLRLGLTRNIK